MGRVSFPLSCTTAANKGKRASTLRVLVPWLVAPDPAGDSALQPRQEIRFCQRKNKWASKLRFSLKMRRERGRKWVLEET